MLEQGTTFAGYRIDGILGQGGMGVVYEATQLSLDRTIALKILAPHLSDDTKFQERFRREGQIQAAIDHPHIITVYEAGDSDYGLFLAMRLVRGPNLKDMIVSREIDAGRTVRILRPVADALDTAHESELIHRDIKPQNILVGARDHPFLADFGLTKGGPAEKSLTRTGQFVGTLDYIAPEQIQGKRATHQSDIYALAAVLYECLTGIVPFPKDSEAAVLYAHLSDAPPSVTDERPELPAGLDDVVAKAMSKEPEERHDSATELLDDAERAFTRRLRAAMTPPGPIEVPQESGIREREEEVATREARARRREEAAPTGTQAAAGAGATAEGIVEETRAAAAAEKTAPPTAEAASPAAEKTRPAKGVAPKAAPAAGAAGATRPAPPAPPSRPGRARAERTPAARPAARPSLGPLLLAAAGALLVAAILAGFLIGKSGSEDAPAELPKSMALGSLEVGFPSDWQRTQDRPDIPGIRFQQPITLAPGGEGEERVTAGQVDATGPALLPRSFVQRLPGRRPPRQRETVRLGELEAYRYTDLKPRGLDGQVTLYVSPTTSDVATVACRSGPGRAGALIADCDRIASSLKLTRGRSFPIGPDERYARTVDGTIERLNAQSRRGKSALRAARTPPGQARGAGQLGRYHADAARRLSGTSVSPAARAHHGAILVALRRTASAYQRMSAAAARGSRGRYNSARGDARRHERALQRALSRLRQLGYSVG